MFRRFEELNEVATVGTEISIFDKYFKKLFEFHQFTIQQSSELEHEKMKNDDAGNYIEVS
jgi:hypothetical protein